MASSANFQKQPSSSLGSAGVRRSRLLNLAFLIGGAASAAASPLANLRKASTSTNGSVELSDSDLLKAIDNSPNTIVCTGSGVSRPSGIYRQKEIKAVVQQRLLNPQRTNSHDSLRINELISHSFGGPRREPNIAHKALVRLQRAGKLQTLITTNVDGLHQTAGSTNVIELGGSPGHLECQKCNTIMPCAMNDPESEPETHETDNVHCEACGSHKLRPAKVAHGRVVSKDAFELAMKKAREANLVLMIGASGESGPMSSIPKIAKANGSFVVEIDTHPNEYTRKGVAHAYHRASAKKLATMLDAHRFQPNGQKPSPCSDAWVFSKTP